MFCSDHREAPPSPNKEPRQSYRVADDAISDDNVAEVGIQRSVNTGVFPAAAAVDFSDEKLSDCCCSVSVTPSRLTLMENKQHSESDKVPERKRFRLSASFSIFGPEK